MCCTKCGGQNIVKSGFVKGQQRYRCKDCCYQFVPTRHHGKSEQEKMTAVLLYINGLSLRTIAKLLKVSNVDIYFADKWEAYKELIANDKLKQTKAKTYRIESNNARQRNWFARFRRKTCIVSQSIQMVDLTMMLFAKFCVNGYFNYTTLFS